nr:reverse transcriptase domain-containing protein [Tanacetum cinerariifolium]
SCGVVEVSMTDNRTMAEMLRAPTEGYAEAIVVPSILAEQFELKHKQTSAMTTATTAMLRQFQATPPLAPVKAVEETCVTCGGAHPYYQCLATVGNTFLELRDNIQGNVLAAAVQYNQGLAQQHQNVYLNELEKVRRMNEANMKAMQTQIDMVKNELRNEMKNSIQTSLINQTNEIKNIMASLLQTNTASTLGSGSLSSNTVANPKGELIAITTRSGLIIDGPTVPTPPTSINPEVDERVEETFTDSDLAEYTIKVPPPHVPKYKPPSQKEFVVHQRDPLYPNIPYPSRMLKQKQQEKDEVQIQNFWQMFKKLHVNVTLADALILMPKYQKMLKDLLSNKEKLQELENTPLNENCSAVILKKLPEKLGDPGKFLIPCGFSELKCKALADLSASINLTPLSVWKKLGLPELISTRMTLKLANRAICTPTGIARDVFVPVGKFTFPANFVIVDYESDLRVPLILGRPFLRTARALIDVHNEEIILRDGDERLTLNMKHNTTSYSNHPHRESSNLINSFNVSSEHFLEISVSNQQSGNPALSLHQEFTSPKSDLEEIEFLLYQGKDSSLKDSSIQMDRANLDDYFVDPIPEMFTEEHAPDYSSPPKFDVYLDDFLKNKSYANNFYDDPFNSEGEKIKESKLLMDELDLPCNSLPYSETDSFNSQDFSRVDDLPSPDNEDKVFNLEILIHEKSVTIITRVAQEKKLAISYASLVFKDFEPPFCAPLFFKDVPKSRMLLLFSTENKERVFKPGIHTSRKDYPNCEVFRALSFSFTRASHPQLHFGNP